MVATLSPPRHLSEAPTDKMFEIGIECMHQRIPRISGITATALCRPAWMLCCSMEDCYCYVIGLLPSIAIEQGFITRSSAH